VEKASKNKRIPLGTKLSEKDFSTYVVTELPKGKKMISHS